MDAHAPNRAPRPCVGCSNQPEVVCLTHRFRHREANQARSRTGGSVSSRLSTLIVVLCVALFVGPFGLGALANQGSTVDGLKRRVLGYYVEYDPTSWAALEAQARQIDIVAATWVTIDGCGRLTTRDDRTLTRFARANGIQVFPSVLTSSGWLNHMLLADDETTARAVDEIVGYVVQEGYEGFDVDFEAIRPADRVAYSAFVERLAARLHERGKLLSLAIPVKATDTTTGWAGAYDYAALGRHADSITIMAYEYHGGWGSPGPIAPYDEVERGIEFATSQIPPEKVLLGLAFYGFDWNVTSGGARYLGSPEAAAIAERYGARLTVDPAFQSATFRYRAPAGDAVVTPPRPPRLQHEIVERRPAACSVVDPAPTAVPTPTPAIPPDALQEHVVWLEESSGAEARLQVAERYRTGGVATWRLGHEDARTWTVFERWRQGER